MKDFESMDRVLMKREFHDHLVCHLKFDQLFSIEEKKQAAADVLFNYSKFALVCIGNQVRPCDLKLHLMKEISGIPTSLRRASSSHVGASTEVMGESSSSGNSRVDKADNFKAI